MCKVNSRFSSKVIMKVNNIRDHEINRLIFGIKDACKSTIENIIQPSSPHPYENSNNTQILANR